MVAREKIHCSMCRTLVLRLQSIGKLDCGLQNTDMLCIDIMTLLHSVAILTDFLANNESGKGSYHLSLVRVGIYAGKLLLQWAITGTSLLAEYSYVVMERY